MIENGQVRHTIETKRKMSKSMGGISYLIATELDAGKPFELVAKDLQQNLGIEPIRIWDAERKTLKRWGYNLYETIAERHKRLDDVFSNPESSDDVILESIKDVSISYFKANRGPDRYFSSLSFLLAKHGLKREKEFHVIPQIFQEDNIAVGEVFNIKQRTSRKTINYSTHFIWNGHEDRAVNTLVEYGWPHV